MKNLIIYFSLLTLAIIGMVVARHHQQIPDALVTTSNIPQAQPHLSAQRQISSSSARKLSSAPIVDRKPATAPAKQAALRAFAQLPLDFEANRGQAPADFDFVSHGPGYVLGLSPRVASLSVQHVTNHAASKATLENFGVDNAEHVVSSPLELRLVNASA